MGQAFWTGVRLPSSPPESSGTVKNDLHFSQSLFCAFFFEMTVNGSPLLSSRAEPHGDMGTKASELYGDYEPGDLPPQWGLLTSA